MTDMWDLFNQLDVQSKAKGLLASIDTADPRFLAAVVALLIYIGSKTVSGQPGLRALGLRLGVATFLLYGGYAYYFAATPENESLAWLALRAANVGGAVLAVTWITLPVISFICSHFRIALAAFLGYCGYAVITADSFDTEQLPGIALRGLVVVALTLVVAWIVQPVLEFFRDLLPRPTKDDEKSSGFQRKLRRTRRDRTMMRQPADTIKSEHQDLVDPVELAESMLQAEAQRRRDKARLNIELAYAMAMPDIAARLPRPAFDELLQRFLGDQVVADDIDENLGQLQLILQQHHKPARPEPEFTDLEDLGRWFLEEQSRIQVLVIDQHFKQSKLAALQQQYMALANKLLHHSQNM